MAGRAVIAKSWLEPNNPKILRSTAGSPASLVTLIALATALCLTGGTISAQDEDLEQVVVTGSRIARPDFDSASPIVSVTEDLFQRTGSRTVESTLNTLPQFAPAYTSTSNNPANGGQANVSLRGLGPTATLVLVDGKRLIPANGNGVADLNIIPSTLIESVEIITGGASAVYGSDALAGVVNFKLKHKFDRVEIDGTWSQTDRGDGTQYEVALTTGMNFADGRGSLIGSLGYADRELVTLGEREFSQYALAYAGGPGLGTLGPQQSFLPFGSGSIEEGRVAFSPPNLPTQEAFDAVMASYGYAPGSVPYQRNRNFGFNTDGTLFTQGSGFYFAEGIPAVANFRGERDPVFFNERLYTWNFAPPNALQLPLERKSAFVRAEFEITDSARVYGQGLYSDYSATGRLAPTPLFGTFIPITNPFIPADLRQLAESRPQPAADLDFGKRLSELGPRLSETQYDVYQVTLGIAGSVFDDWEYEAYVQVGANDQENHQTGNVLTSKIEELTFAPDGGVSICGGFDPFGLNSISPECLDYISIDASNHAAVDQTIVEATLSGPLVSLPAGELRAAMGAFYKEDRYEYTASPEASVFLPDGRSDIQGFLASDDIRNNDHNADLYLEVLLPLLSDVPGVRSLETVFGYRLSDYASAGSFDSWKAELLYEPVDGIRMRSSFQEAVRAPSVSELYLPQLPFTFDYFQFEDFVEPCDVNSVQRNGPDATRVEALCLAQGVPAAALPEFVDADEVAPGVAGGNPDLRQEEATTTTVGAVWTSRLSHPLLTDLQLSLDWYRIEIADAISTLAFHQFVQNCYDARANPDFSVTSEWCTYFGRDPATGEINNVQELLRNGGDLQTDGVDMQLDWRFDLGPGQLGFNWLVTWTDSYTVGLDNSGVPADEFVGTVGRGFFLVDGAVPEWKSNLHVSYAWGDLTVGAVWRYIDGMTDADPDLSPVFKVPSMDYFDLNAGYEFTSGMLEGLRLGAGVENLTDEDPPIFPSFIQANTDPSQYDVFGRRYYMSLTYAF